MDSKGYKLIGFAVWNGGRWYVRQKYLRRLPSAGKIAATGLGVLAAGGVVVIAVRRVQS